jgi:HK97 gp10 family phage protein
MIEFRVSTSGLEFDEVAQKLSGKLRQKLIDRLTDIAFEAVFWGAPVKTGYLASTVYKEIGFGEAKVGAAASYAAAVEFGTAPHEIRPINGRVLAFKVAGKMVFTPLVHHPGNRANPFMQRALDEALGKVDSVFADLWLELVGG